MIQISFSLTSCPYSFAQFTLTSTFFFTLLILVFTQPHPIGPPLSLLSLSFSCLVSPSLHLTALLFHLAHTLLYLASFLFLLSLSPSLLALCYFFTQPLPSCHHIYFPLDSVSSLFNPHPSLHNHSPLSLSFLYLEPVLNMRGQYLITSFNCL